MPLTTQEEIAEMHDRKGRKKPGCPLPFLALLLAALLSCGLVQLWAEPIDRQGCKWDCDQAGMEFSCHRYKDNTCFCLADDGAEVQLY